MLYRGKLTKSFYLFQSKWRIDIRALFWTAILLRVWCKHMFTPASAVTPVNNFRLKMSFLGGLGVGWGWVWVGGGGGWDIKTTSIEFVDHTRIFVDITYLCTFPCQQEHAKLCIKWLTLAWDCVFSFMSKHSTGKFAIMCNITGVIIGRKFTQHLWGFFVQKGIHARNHTRNTNYSWKSINVIVSYFT